MRGGKPDIFDESIEVNTLHTRFIYVGWLGTRPKRALVSVIYLLKISVANTTHLLKHGGRGVAHDG